jgi:CRP-like cAMP-binding protein
MSIARPRYKPGKQGGEQTMSSPVTLRDQLKKNISPRIELDPGLRKNNVVAYGAMKYEAAAGKFASTVNELLKMFSPALWKRLAPHTRRASFMGGEFLYRPDEEISWIYFPETNAISELQILEDGRTIEVALTGREGAIGLLGIYSPAPAVNWVQVSAPGTALKIKRDVLYKELRNLDWVNRVIYDSIQSYVRQISQKVACNAHHSVEERFSTWLLMLEDRCASTRLKLTQEQIARVLGVYRPSVTCIAQQLRELGLIDYVRGNIVILDREKLKERCCGCYTDLDLGRFRTTTVLNNSRHTENAVASGNSD